jgi:hypothetical protein
MLDRSGVRMSRPENQECLFTGAIIAAEKMVNTRAQPSRARSAAE